MSTELDNIKRSTQLAIKSISSQESEDRVAVFDPRVKFKSKEKEEEGTVIWSTKSINLALDAINDGQSLRISPFLKSDSNLRKPNLLFQYTEEEITEILRCRNDIIYFAEKYVMLKTDNGLQHIKLRPYQKTLLRNYQNNRWCITLFPRQAGKTTTTAIFFAHFTTFFVDKNCAVIAQRDNIASEIFSKIKSIIYYLPFFMKPGCLSFTKGGYHFDNGCTMCFRPAGIDALQGYTLDTLFIDEFAYIKNAKARDFWNNVYPTLSSLKNSRVMICSTPNGKNLFYELWTRSLEGKNLFKHFRIDWWEVPGRDEKWKEQEIANLGTQEAFDQQYGLSFDTNVNAILSNDIFHFLNKIAVPFKDGLFNLGTDWDDAFRWSTKWKYSFKKDWFLISVDIGEGLGSDYSTIKIRKIFKTPDGNIIFPTIGVFESNTIIIEDFAKVLLLSMRKFNQEHCRLVIERNSFGDLLIKNMESLAERIPDMEIEVETIAKFRRSVDNPKMEKGIRLNRQNKRAGVANWKKLVDDKIFIETDSKSIDQYREFGENKKNGTYQATIGHDDLVMPDVNAAFYIKSNNTGWNEFLEEFDASVDVDIFNTTVMDTLQITAINAIKMDTTLDGDEYDFTVIDVEDVDNGNEYDDVDKYLAPKKTRTNPHGLSDEDKDEYDMLDSLIETERLNKRLGIERYQTKEERNKNIADDLLL